jgi:peptidoglycan LD-endopeptidase CwlK
MVDKASEEKIAKLHPHIKDEIHNLVSKINEEVLTGQAKVRIAQGLRTFAEQDKLFAQRPKVTNARGGDSIHNYGLAIDIVLIIDGKVASWDTKKDFDKDLQSDWMEVVSVLKKAGYSWGGDWRTFKDMPHFEKTGGHSLQQIKEKHKNKEFITGTTFIKI